MTDTQQQTQNLAEIFTDLSSFEVNELSELCISKEWFGDRRQ